MKSASIVFSVVLLSGCASNGGGDGEVFYLRTDYGRGLDVFNYNHKWISNEGVSYLCERDQEYGEFGGRFYTCDENSEYLCIIGGIAAAVPVKAQGQTKWQVSEWSCSAEMPLVDGELINIACEYKGQRSDFTYSSRRGVTAYYRDQHDGSVVTYVLVGEFGVLSKRMHNKTLQPMR